MVHGWIEGMEWGRKRSEGQTVVIHSVVSGHFRVLILYTFKKKKKKRCFGKTKQTFITGDMPTFRAICTLSTFV